MISLKDTVSKLPYLPAFCFPSSKPENFFKNVATLPDSPTKSIVEYSASPMRAHSETPIIPKSLQSKEDFNNSDSEHTLINHLADWVLSCESQNSHLIDFAVWLGNYAEELEPNSQRILLCKNIDLKDKYFTQIPNNLEVKGDVKIQFSKLKTLPESFAVQGKLDLSYCGFLENLGKKLELGGNLILDGCKKITYLPPSILSLGARKDGQTRIIYLRETGIPREQLKLLQNSNIPGINFIID